MVIVYGSITCSPCKALKKWLEEKGIHYEYRDVLQYAEEAGNVSEKTGFMSLPIVKITGRIGTRYVEGFNTKELSLYIP